MFNLFKTSKNKKISKANKAYYQAHGLTRRVKVSNIQGLEAIYLPKRRSFQTV